MLNLKNLGMAILFMSTVSANFAQAADGYLVCGSNILVGTADVPAAGTLPPASYGMAPVVGSRFSTILDPSNPQGRIGIETFGRTIEFNFENELYAIRLSGNVVAVATAILNDPQAISTALPQIENVTVQVTNKANGDSVSEPISLPSSTVSTFLTRATRGSTNMTDYTTILTNVINTPDYTIYDRTEAESMTQYLYRGSVVLPLEISRAQVQAAGLREPRIFSDVRNYSIRGLMFGCLVQERPISGTVAQ